MNRVYKPVPALDRYKDAVTFYLCPDCGSAVLLTDTHDRWHEEHDHGS